MTVNAELQRRAARLVSQEVNACMSSLVATLARAGAAEDRELNALMEQAVELAVPVPDYEGAAREDGWLPDLSGADGACYKRDHGETHEAYGWYDACVLSGIEPHEIEVYEHWAVSTWLAEKLLAKGERVDTDFAGLNVWARTTTGQAISADSVIETIASETGYASGGA